MINIKIKILFENVLKNFRDFSQLEMKFLDPDRYYSRKVSKIPTTSNRHTISLVQVFRLSQNQE